MFGIDSKARASSVLGSNWTFRRAGRAIKVQRRGGRPEAADRSIQGHRHSNMAEVRSSSPDSPATAPVAAAASPVTAAVIVATAVIAASVIASATSMVAAPTTASAMTTATAVTTATAAVGGVSLSYSEGANHEGKGDSRRQSGYPGTQFLFRLES